LGYKLNDLPKLSAQEQEHSQKLIHVIQQNIAAAGGKIPFSEFMAACLYTPGLGYYSAGATKFGQAGDFVTAPEISILFGQCLAEYFYKVKKQNFANQPLSIIELGAGTGKLAGDILTHLNKLDALPAHYYILEVSADLKEKQQIYLKILCLFIETTSLG
jgi:SAM-dependent MidA family methyltransferase